MMAGYSAITGDSFERKFREVTLPGGPDYELGSASPPDACHGGRPPGGPRVGGKP
jgi:hypothetical protein